jgi:hypothetical protein
VRPEPCQPQRQHEARRSRSDDEDVGHDGLRPRAVTVTID